MSLQVGDVLFYRQNGSAVTTTKVVDLKGNFAELQNGDVACIEPLPEEKNCDRAYKGIHNTYKKVYESVEV